MIVIDISRCFVGIFWSRILSSETRQSVKKGVENGLDRLLDVVAQPNNVDSYKKVKRYRFILMAFLLSTWASRHKLPPLN